MKFLLLNGECFLVLIMAMMTAKMVIVTNPPNLLDGRQNMEHFLVGKIFGLTNDIRIKAGTNEMKNKIRSLKF